MASMENQTTVLLRSVKFLDERKALFDEGVSKVAKPVGSLKFTKSFSFSKLIIKIYSWRLNDTTLEVPTSQWSQHGPTCPVPDSRWSRCG